MMERNAEYMKREDDLIAAALKAKRFRRAVPDGMGERLRLRIRASSGGGRHRWKIAAGIVAIASFAVFAATLAVRFAGGGEEAKTAMGNAPGQMAEEVAAEDTFEEIFSEELAELKRQEEEQAMNTRVRGLAAGAIAAATAFSVPSAQGDVRASVFDDAVVWYRGALEAQSYYSNGPAGTYANNGTKTAKAFKSILHTANPSSAPEMKWSWGWGAETTLDSAPVACPYANCKLTGVTYANRPIPVQTNGWEEVTVNGATTSQPVLSHYKGPEYLNSGVWAAGATSYSLVLRLRVDEPLNNLSGANDTGGGFSIFAETQNYKWASNAGAGLRVAFTGDTLGTYRVPRIFFGGVNYNFSNTRIPFGNWVDIAISVNGSSVIVAACAQGESGNTLEWKTETLPSGVNAALPASGDTFRFFGPKCSGGYTTTWTNAMTTPSINSEEHGMRTQHFRGAVHQMAFWDRALSANEIREAWGEGRPNLVHVGVEGNGTAEFAATETSVSNGGAWQQLNPVLTAENPSAAITFDCPALWTGLPQYLRLPMAATSSQGAVGIKLNDELLGVVNVYPGRTSSVYIEGGKIVSGVNTIAIERMSGGALVLDAVTLGGSWKFGESVTSFNDAAVDANTASKVGVDCWVFSPACGNDKFHARGTTWSIGGDELSFPVFIPADLVGKIRGELLFKTATASNPCKFKWLLNNSELNGETTGDAQTEYTCKVLNGAFVDGWNNLVWNRTNSWMNFNTFQFTVLPPVKGLLLIVK